MAREMADRGIRALLRKADDSDMAGRLRSALPSRSVAAITSLAVIVLAALSGCGGGTSTSTTTVASQGVVIQVTSPSNGATINANTVTIRGTVSPSNATVQIAGQPAAVGNGVFTGSTSLQQGKNSIDVIASAPGKSPGSTTIVVSRSGAGGSSASSSGSQGNGGAPNVAYAQPGSQTSGQSSCGGGLSVGPSTSCSFAQNVESAYRGGSGPGTLEVYSPVTGQNYSMTCNLNGNQVVCTGGNNASVYFPQ